AAAPCRSSRRIDGNGRGERAYMNSRQNYNGKLAIDYEEYGFAGPIDVLSQTEVAQTLRDVKDELSKDDGSRFKLHLILPSVEKINAKTPGFFAAHQDCAFAGLQPSNCVLTAWIALTDPVGETETGEKGDNLLSVGQYIDDTKLKTLEKPVSLPLRAGQASLHSFDTVHSSSPNESDCVRIGLALRFMSCEVQQTKQNAQREMVTRIAGCSRTDSNMTVHASFDFEPRIPASPTDEDFAKMRQIQKEALRREEMNYFAG
ncbi:hypothetical protein THAOC_09241, partial [Thalassiosira oceanica]